MELLPANPPAGLSRRPQYPPSCQGEEGASKAVSPHRSILTYCFVLISKGSPSNYTSLQTVFPAPGPLSAEASLAISLSCSPPSWLLWSTEIKSKFKYRGQMWPRKRFHCPGLGCSTEFPQGIQHLWSTQICMGVLLFPKIPKPKY